MNLFGCKVFMKLTTLLIYNVVNSPDKKFSILLEMLHEPKPHSMSKQSELIANQPFYARYLHKLECLHSTVRLMIWETALTHKNLKHFNRNTFIIIKKIEGKKKLSNGKKISTQHEIDVNSLSVNCSATCNFRTKAQSYHYERNTKLDALFHLNKKRTSFAQLFHKYSKAKCSS